MKKILIVLSGAGWLDGTFPVEMAFILYELEKRGLQPLPCALDKMTEKVINHQTKKFEEHSRNILVESARLVKGDVIDISKVNPKSIDGMILPGGRGVLQNLCSLEEKKMHTELKQLIKTLYLSGIPIATLGYGGVLPVIALRKATNVILTLGGDAIIGEVLEKFGTILVNVTPNEIVIDEENNIISTPGITPKSSIINGADGISQLIKEMLDRRVTDVNIPSE